MKNSPMERLRDPKTSVGQLEKMLQFMMQNPDFANGKLVGLHGRTMSQNLWENLADILNSDKSGPKKPVYKWQKSWVDWKCNTKRKYVRMKSHRMGTDDEHTNHVPISKLEEKLLAFIMPDSIGDADLLLKEAEPPPANNEMPGTSYPFVGDLIMSPNLPTPEAVTPTQDKKKKHGTGQEMVKGFVTSQRKRLRLEERKLEVEEKRLQLEEKGHSLKEKMLEEYVKRNRILEETLVDEKRRTDVIQSFAISIIEFFNNK